LARGGGQGARRLVRSVRFLVLLVLVALAALASVDSATGPIRDATDAASQTPSVFLLLFTLSPDRVPAFHEFVGILGPLLGIAFGFDAISGERSQRTLPRLVAQPIHRDDVINGKFVAGLAAITVVLVTITTMVVGYGIWKLGQIPGPEEVVRIAAFLVVAVAYVALWLGLAIVASVFARRAATAALVTIAAWLVLTLFAGLIAGVIADARSPVDDPASAEQVLDNARTELTVRRFSPDQLYTEATGVLLNPARRTTGIVVIDPASRSVQGALSLRNSLLLAWWQLMAIIAGAIVTFTVAYLAFLRLEIRA
jgi:ABC-2 type transport system permease protein